MQTPAPFEYERATSVEGAIASLQRLGSGGARHRGRAQPAADDEAPAGEPGAPDRHQRPDGALVHPRGGRRDPDRGADPPRGAAEVGAARPALSALSRRRERDRRPGRAQPRHDRRLALPGGRGRGSLGRLLGGQGEGRDPRRRRRAGGRDGGLPRRAVRDRGRRRRAAHRGPGPAAAGRRQRAREGRAPRRRLGDRRRVRGGLDRGRHDRRRGHRAQRGRADDDPPLASRGAAAGQGSVGGALRAGGRDRLGGLLADAGRSRAGRLQAPSRRRPHDTAPCSRAAARAEAQEA